MSKDKTSKEKDYMKVLEGKNRFNDLESKVGIDCDRLKTGSIKLDMITGGGLVNPGIIEIFGAENSGKTTIALEVANELQTKDKKNIVAFIDMEHAFDTEYAKRIGLNLKSAFPINQKTGQMNFDKRNEDGQFLFSQPDFGEQALSIVESLLQIDDIKLIIIDSVAALVPKAELEGEITDKHIGHLARMMSRHCRVATPKCKKSKTTVIYLNQTRTNIMQMFGDKENPTGGNALKFYSRMRFKIKKLGKYDVNGEVVGTKSLVNLVKNKVGAAHKQAIVIFGNNGIVLDEELFEIAMDEKIVKKQGSWFEIGSEKFQGKDNAYEYFSNNEKLKTKVKDFIYKKVGIVE